LHGTRIPREAYENTKKCPFDWLILKRYKCTAARTVNIAMNMAETPTSTEASGLPPNAAFRGGYGGPVAYTM